MDDDLDLDNDDNFDFLKEKHESDKSLVSQLNQITNQSELRIESAASKGRRGGSSRDHSATFLYTPPAPASSNNSRPGSNASSQRRPVSGSNRAMFNIPPAEKNMEVVIGKGRRLNSATGGSSSRTNSNIERATTQNTSQRKNSLSGMPPLPNRQFSCENCNKKYSNGKDLDIHKMYCNV